MDKMKGIILCFVIALCATVLGSYMPVIGSVIFSLIIGIILNQLMTIKKDTRIGVTFCGKKVLQYAIILMGFTLSFRVVGELGLKSLPLTLLTITAALMTSFVMGQVLGINQNIRRLIGAGTAICGGSAIAALSPVIRAKEDEVAFSMSVIFMFNIIAVFIFPVIGHMLNLSDNGFGHFAGMAINDTSSVVAAGYHYSTEAGDTATIVKLVRALMIVPVCFIFLWIEIRRNKNEDHQINIKKIFPWFILYFFLASVFASLVPIPEGTVHVIKVVSTFMIAMALAGIGMAVDFNKFRTIGMKPVVVGLITWAAVAVSALLLQHAAHIW